MKKINQLSGMVMVAAVSALAVAQNAGTAAKSAAEAKAAIDTRQTLFKDIKKSFDPMTAMLKRQRPFDAAVVATNAIGIQELAQKMPAQFAVDTRAFKDIETDSLDGIWTNQADFKAKADVLAKAAANAAAVAGGGDQGATLKAVAEIGKSCGGCHDSYRTKS